MSVFETDECSPAAGSIDDIPVLTQRLKAMFQEMPGMRLSAADAARLAGLDPSVAGDILESLADAHFLKRGSNGTFGIV